MKEKNKRKPGERREQKGKREKKEKRKEKKEEKSEEKKRKEWRRKEKAKKKWPKLAPYSHQPTRLLLPSSRLLPDVPLAITTPTSQPVSSCHRQNSSLMHLLPSSKLFPDAPPAIVKTLP
jgi:hypothetical protein